MTLDGATPRAESSVHSVDIKIVFHGDLPINKIKHSPWKIRKTHSTILDESVGKSGVLEPIGVVEIGKGKYQVIFGDSRLDAAKAHSLTKIPAIVYRCTKEVALLWHGIENLHRSDWTELEEGEYYSKVTRETGMSLREMEELFHVSKSQIGYRIKFFELSEKLTRRAKRAIANNKISTSAVEHAFDKLPENDALRVIEKAVEEKLDSEDLISEVNAVKPTAEVHEKANALPDHKVQAVKETAPEPERLFAVFKYELQGRVEHLSEQIQIQSNGQAVPLASELERRIQEMKAKLQLGDLVTISVLAETPMKKRKEAA
jgi:ParB/RepB/Spo0J family partition protein